MDAGRHGTASMIDTLRDGIGSLVGLLLGLLMIFLFISGVSYRKECVGSDGEVTKDWTFQWFAPLPFVFRPGVGSNCVVHTGTRVALNAVGIAGYQPTSASLIADRAAEGAGNDSGSYLNELGAAVAAYMSANKQTNTWSQSMGNVKALEGRLAQMTPPTRYRTAHRKALSAVRGMEQHGQELRDAAEQRDQARYNRVRARLVSDTKRMLAAFQEIDRLRNTE